MGIIVFSLALLPQLGVSAIHMMRAEVPGPTADKLTPRIQDTARVLWKVYFIISAAEVVALMIAGMSPFDAFCHTFTTMATGGFSTHNKGIMAFSDNPAILVVLTLFMFAAGANFALHTSAILHRRFSVYLKDSEFRVFAILILLLTFLVFVGLLSAKVYPKVWLALLHSAFNVVSLITTTGYNSADFEAWGVAAPAIAWLVFLMMFLGGMSGSTGGAIKTIRIWVLVKTAIREFRRNVHPHGVFKVRAGTKTVSENIVRSITGFFVLYMGIFFIGTAAVSASGEDFITSSSAVASCLGNVGPGLGEVGPTDNYYHLKDWVKWLLSVFMVVGRLELYTVLVLLYPAFWKK